MRIPKKVLPGLAVVLALAGLLVAGAWALAQTRYAADRVALLVEAATGQPVQIDELSVAFGTGLGVRLEGLAIASRRPGAPAALLDVGTLEAELPWRAAIGGQFVVRQLKISRAVVRVDVDAEGRDEWTPMLAHITEWVGPGESRFDIGRLEMADGTVEFRDQRSGQSLRLDGVALQALNVRPKTSFAATLRLAGQAGPRTFHASLQGRISADLDASRYAASELQLKGWAGGEPLPLAGVEAAGRLASAALDLGAGTAGIEGLELNLAGIALAARAEAQGLNAKPSLAFELRARDFDPRAAAEAFGVTLPPTTDAAVLRRASAEFAGSATAAVVTLGHLQASVDDTALTGTLTWPLQGDAAPSLRLAADRIDLDRYLPPAQPGAKPGDPAQALEQALAALRELDVDAKVSFDEARLAGARARRLTIVIEPNVRDGQPPR